ncbi:hypothetical protein BX661DRAFT_103330 [Kickxella alabastrina]|uniref:uncharacterized protein n=1 Tax=Kickxella alabastrina TaxID=61397 RepID=UPI002220FFAC|nr:uncharacterized protein BX661DRAFT_103330 [Kickxella alabastrina]KAI7818970.1 hypothetical protein BX661DRAFT_103330 [Kickxella alabastrina]
MVLRAVVFAVCRRASRVCACPSKSTTSCRRCCWIDREAREMAFYAVDPWDPAPSVRSGGRAMICARTAGVYPPPVDDVLGKQIRRPVCHVFCTDAVGRRKPTCGMLRCLGCTLCCCLARSWSLIPKIRLSVLGPRVVWL